MFWICKPFLNAHKTPHYKQDCIVCTCRPAVGTFWSWLSEIELNRGLLIWLQICSRSIVLQGVAMRDIAHWTSLLLSLCNIWQIVRCSKVLIFLSITNRHYIWWQTNAQLQPIIHSEHARPLRQREYVLKLIQNRIY